jgi:tRNA threonylcarbamoyladenosine biosynthesis protein TsaE
MTSVKTKEDMVRLGELLGKKLQGGEVIELIGDVGAGKTTFVKGLGKGLGIDDEVQSPSFTISRVYEARDGLALHHYDFYRLQDAGILGMELAESIEDPQAITVIEWADTVQNVLPHERLVLRLNYKPDGEGRNIEWTGPEKLAYLAEELR